MSMSNVRFASGYDADDGSYVDHATDVKQTLDIGHLDIGLRVLDKTAPPLFSGCTPVLN